MSNKDWLDEIDNDDLKVKPTNHRIDEIPIRKKPGRKPKIKKPATIKISEIDAAGPRRIFIDGHAQRVDVTNVNVPIPKTLYEKIKRESGTVVPAIVGLLQYAMDKLESDNQSIMITFDYNNND